MSWEHFVEVIDTLLGTVLIGKLWFTGLYKCYRVFWFFLVFSLFSSYCWLVLWLGAREGAFKHVDYQIVWLSTSLPIWILTMFMVYSQMEKILANLPGIAKLSKTVLNVACIIAIGLGIISAFVEYGAWGIWDANRIIMGLTAGGIIVNRVCASIALLVFLSILTFLVWFPVSVSRNLASLTVGLLIYFAGKTTLLVARGAAWSDGAVRLTSTSITVISSLCFAYWIIQITPKGETVPGQLKLPWRNLNKEHLVRQLELLDQSLVHAARR